MVTVTPILGGWGGGCLVPGAATDASLPACLADLPGLAAPLRGTVAVRRKPPVHQRGRGQSAARKVPEEPGRPPRAAALRRPLDHLRAGGAPVQRRPEDALHFPLEVPVRRLSYGHRAGTKHLYAKHAQAVLIAIVK